MTQRENYSPFLNKTNVPLLEYVARGHFDAYPRKTKIIKERA